MDNQKYAIDWSISGWWFSPPWKLWVRQWEGLSHISIYIMEHKTHVWNHQPDIISDMDLDLNGSTDQAVSRIHRTACRDPFPAWWTDASWSVHRSIEVPQQISKSANPWHVASGKHTKTMEKSTIFNREVNEQNGPFSIDFNSYVKLPENIT